MPSGTVATHDSIKPLHQMEEKEEWDEEKDEKTEEEEEEEDRTEIIGRCESHV